MGVGRERATETNDNLFEPVMTDKPSARMAQPDSFATGGLLLCLLLLGCSPEPCYVKNADGSWRATQPGQWHYDICKGRLP